GRTVGILVPATDLLGIRPGNRRPVTRAGPRRLTRLDHPDTLTTTQPAAATQFPALLPRNAIDETARPASLPGGIGHESNTYRAPVDLATCRSPLSWLLIAQRLAEQTPVDVGRTIRRAYQRSGRPAPDVRLVQLKGAPTSGDNQARPAAGRADQRPDRQFRWWVRGHWRNQAYGP